MSVEEFFELFLQELRQNDSMKSYYKYLEDEAHFNFRKAYFIQRLQYVKDHIKPGARIWDCGCGYGTTALYLAMNGISVFGNTLEFYFKEIPGRKAYWKQYGNVDLFTCTYEDLFDTQYPAGGFDQVIIQDTLHHLEPIDKALEIIGKALSANGEIISIEENGDNIIQSLKLYKQRGNKRIITFYDEQLKKNITIGNENIRGVKLWEKVFEKNGFVLDRDSLQYIRFYLPQFTGKFSSAEELAAKEQTIESAFLRKYFFFGINFIGKKVS